MFIAALVLAGLAAVLHIIIFEMESISWTGARARAAFGMDEHEAEATREMAFNQGFYNLFLAADVFVGIMLLLFVSRDAGLASILVGVGSMFAASAVLFFGSPDKSGAARKQGLLPLLSIILFLFALLG